MASKPLLPVVISFFLAASVLHSHALSSLSVSDGVTTVTVTDQQVGDGSPTQGSIQFSSTSFPNWGFIFISATTRPVIGKPTAPELDLTYNIARTGPGSGTLTIRFSETNFILGVGANGTVASGGNISSATSTNRVRAFYDPSNVLFGAANLSTAHRFAGPGSFSGIDLGDVYNPNGALSLTLVSELTVPSGTSSSGDIDLKVGGARILDLVRAQSISNNLPTVQWTATFNAALTNLTATNFALNNSIGSPAITAVSPSGPLPAPTWTISANTSPGTGNLGLSMVNSTGISSNIFNLPFEGGSYIIDRVAPDTTITAGPPATTNSSSASFSFTGTDVGVGNLTFQGQLDGAGFSNRVSPLTLTNLTLGPHTFQVRAIDGVGNTDASPALVTWTNNLVPTLKSTTRLSDGTIQFSFYSSFATNLVALFATNISVPLSNWTVLGPVLEETPGNFRFTDADATNHGAGFYKVLAQ